MTCPVIAGQVNWWAVVVSVAVSLGIGILWYAPFSFGHIWLKGIGMDEKDIREGTPLKATIVSLFTTTISVLALAGLLKTLAITGFVPGACTGAVIGFCFVSMAQLSNSVFEQRPITVWLVHAGCQIIGFAVSGGILAAWQ